MNPPYPGYFEIDPLRARQVMDEFFQHVCCDFARPMLDLSQTYARPSKCTPETCSTTTPIFRGGSGSRGARSENDC